MKIKYSYSVSDTPMVLKELISTNKLHGVSIDKTEDDVGYHNHYHKIRKKGTIGLLCPDCYHVEFVKIRNQSFIEVESDDVDIRPHIDICYTSYKCKHCGRYVRLIELDPNITEAISILNLKGYYTKYCCEGHKYDNAYISFHNDKYINYVINTLPISWFIDNEVKPNYIKSDYNEYVQCLIETGKVYIRNNIIQYKDLIIRSDNPKEEAMQDILIWAKALPYVEELEIYRDKIIEQKGAFVC